MIAEKGERFADGSSFKFKGIGNRAMTNSDSSNSGECSPIEQKSTAKMTLIGRKRSRATTGDKSGSSVRNVVKIDENEIMDYPYEKKDDLDSRNNLSARSVSIGKLKKRREALKDSRGLTFLSELPIYKNPSDSNLGIFILSLSRAADETSLKLYSPPFSLGLYFFLP